jgi:hypothetical protein
MNYLLGYCYFFGKCEYTDVRKIAFRFSMSGKSSGELGSVMILSPMVGNRFEEEG